MARSTVRLELNSKGIRHAMKYNQDIRDGVKEVAEAGAEQANRNSKDKNAKYEANTFTGVDRYRAHISPANDEAFYEERENRSLSRILGGGFL